MKKDEVTTETPLALNSVVIGRFTIHGQTLEISLCDNGEMLKIEKVDGDKTLHLEQHGDTHEEGENILYVW